MASAIKDGSKIKVTKVVELEQDSIILKLNQDEADVLLGVLGSIIPPSNKAAKELSNLLNDLYRALKPHTNYPPKCELTHLVNDKWVHGGHFRLVADQKV